MSTLVRAHTFRCTDGVRCGGRSLSDLAVEYRVTEVSLEKGPWSVRGQLEVLGTPDIGTKSSKRKGP